MFKSEFVEIQKWKMENNNKKTVYDKNSNKAIKRCR